MPHIPDRFEPNEPDDSDDAPDEMPAWAIAFGERVVAALETQNADGGFGFRFDSFDLDYERPALLLEPGIGEIIGGPLDGERADFDISGVDLTALSNAFSTVETFHYLDQSAWGEGPVIEISGIIDDQPVVVAICLTAQSDREPDIEIDADPSGSP